MRLDAAAVVYTKDGPKHVEELTKGMAAWGLHQGKPTFVTIAATSRSRPESSSGFWLYGKGADLFADSETLVATSAGLRSMQQLFVGRESSYGYMAGSWPRVELFRFPAGLQTSTVQFLKRLIACASSVGRNGLVCRVGAHSTEKLRGLGRVLFEGRAAIEHGPAGWSWLTGSPREVPLATEFQPEDGVLFWKLGGSGYMLPIQETKLRYLTLAWLTSHDIRFELDLRPRYSPSEVAVQLVSAKHSHAEISGLLSQRTPTLYEVTLSEKGDYLGVNGLVCA